MYKLGFDIDEVVCKTGERIESFLLEKHGVELDMSTVKDHNFTKHPLYEEYPEVFEELFKEFRDVAFFNPCNPYKKGVNTLRKLYKKGHYLYFISSRPKGDEEKTARWFRSHKIPFHAIYHVDRKGEKGVVGRQLNLDFYVDDHIDDIESMLKYKKRWTKGVFLFDKPWNKYYTNDMVRRVFDWNDIFNIINIPG